MHLNLQSIYCTLYFSNNHKEKNSGAVETNDPVQPYSSLLCGPEHHLVENTSYGLVGVLGLEIIDHLCVML